MVNKFRQNFTSKAIAFLIALALVLLGMYILFFCDEIYIPSRITTNDARITRPDIYFIGAGVIVIALSIGISNLIDHTVQWQKRFCLSMMIIGILLFLSGV